MFAVGALLNSDLCYRCFRPKIFCRCPGGAR